MSDFLIRLTVRILNRFWGPEPRLTPRALQRARSNRYGWAYDQTDYATKARNSYGDDQY